MQMLRLIRRVPVLVLGVFLLPWLVVFAAGCESDGAAVKAAWQARIAQLEGALEFADTEAASLRESIAENQALLETIPDDDSAADTLRDGIADADRALAQVQAQREVIARAVTTLRERVEAIPDGVSGTAAGILTGAAAVESGAPFLPAPWNFLAIAGAAAATRFVDWWAQRKADRAWDESETAALRRLHAQAAAQAKG